ncbi:hypothetical protein P4O66_009811 [Electrophorus voltai]|uniref:Uncharacterized protein n=1 Tax=Electrophorus voltai TaxID=2609070 RepID=A0AAD9DVD4_9TELE|nr:hypothetical protein P4O66_009811 [Electrophorus voltai]
MSLRLFREVTCPSAPYASQLHTLPVVQNLGGSQEKLNETWWTNPCVLWLFGTLMPLNFDLWSVRVRQVVPPAGPFLGLHGVYNASPSPDRLTERAAALALELSAGFSVLFGGGPESGTWEAVVGPFPTCLGACVDYEWRRKAPWWTLASQWPVVTVVTMATALAVLVPYVVHRMLTAFKDPPPPALFRAATICFGLLSEALLVRKLLSALPSPRKSPDSALQLCSVINEAS